MGQGWQKQDRGPHQVLVEGDVLLWRPHGEDGGGCGGSEVPESECWASSADLGRKVGVPSYREPQALSQTGPELPPQPARCLAHHPVRVSCQTSDPAPVVGPRALLGGRSTEREVKTSEMPRKEEGRTECWVCPHLVLVDLNRLDLLGRAQVCGGRTARGTLLFPASLTTSLPSNATFPYPKAARPHPRHPTAPRGSAPAVPSSGCSPCGPGGPTAGREAVSGQDPGGMQLLPLPRPCFLTMKVPVSRSIACS